jgi:transcriptional regulator with XRE-family HTH domain
MANILAVCQQLSGFFMNESSSVAHYLASNLTALRKNKGLSQQQLAAYAGMPRSTITHMESGGGNPSLTNLCKIATALGVRIEELLSRPRNNCTLVPATQVPTLLRSGGKVRVHKLMPDSVRGVEIDKVDIQPNSSMGGKPHLAGSKEYMITLSGTVVVSVAGHDYTVSEGDVLAFPGDQRHAYRNPGGQSASVLSVVLPLPFHGQ